MLRVCGVTFDHTTNYGSCLQAYALQRVIEEMSIAGEKCSYQLIPRALFPPRAPKPTSLKTKIKRAIKAKLTAYRRKRFIGFEDRYMHYANCRNREDLPKMNAEADAFVCGSDVIWNFNYTGGDKIFFLDFARKYKFSYAASFGKAGSSLSKVQFETNNNPENIFQKYIPLLDAVSVREEDGVILAARLTSKPVELTCDPVLLRTAEEWRSLFVPGTRPKKYIFAYSTSTRPNYVNFLRKIKKQTRLPVISVTWLIADAFKQRAFFFPEPQEWLRLLAEAEYVVTNSFHGTAFSVLFRKKFFTVIQGEKNVRSNVRLYDFLESHGLEDRLITETPDMIDERMPVFSVADSVIKEERSRSLNYLRDNLSAALNKKRDST